MSGPILPVVVPPIFNPPTIEELIELKRNAGQVTRVQLRSPLAVESAPLFAIEVDMWRDAINRSSKSKYIALIEADDQWVVIWNADQFPETGTQQ